VTSPTDPDLPRVRELYESTLDSDERVPWAWIVRGLGHTPTRQDRWWPHLLVAGGASEGVQGYYYGSYLPGFSGYACYLGVDPAARGRGLGRLLFRRLFAAFRRDARRLDEPLPFVIWESHRPGSDDQPAAHANWQARVRLFAKVGAYWINGVDFRVPNYLDRSAAPVELELFLAPFDWPPERFDAPTLRRVIAGLHGRVYGQHPWNELYERAQDPAHEPWLRPVAECG
jgi:GNAT superfamily N-acetyltransferase